MAQSSAFYRTQETIQRARAANAQLENVRAVALRAATAWGNQADLAQLCETRRGEEELPAAGSLSEEADDRMFSENPDRGAAT